LLKKGDPFDVNVLKKERERIADDLRDEGYYLFSRDMVHYDIDSIANLRQMDVDVKIILPSDSAEHRKFYINNIYIHTDFSFEKFSDTTAVYDTLTRGSYHFIYNNRLRIRPYTILTCIYFRRGDLYRRSDVQKTIYNLTDLGVFRFINVKFEELTNDTINLLNCHFYLTPSKRQEITTTFEVNNNTYNLMGINLDLGYLNRNLFRGAERFQFGVTVGAETNFDTNPLFNTTDLSVSSSLLFNKFLIPFRIKNLAKTTRPKTRIGLKFNYLTRIQNFSIFSGSANYGYEWRKNNFRHIFNLMSISFVRAPENRQSDDFRQLLQISPSLRNSFSEQLIVGTNHSLTWNQKLEKDMRHQLFFRINNEIAGNLLNAVSAIVNISKPAERPYKVLGINYAQYYKTESEFRYYFDISKESRWANRFFIGIGIPYANSRVLPYVKQYFSGGSVSLRAWPVRSLGPGSFQYVPGRFNDQTGDIKLELNTEMRFNMIKFIKGALFIDAGNIWLSRIDPSKKGAEFSWSRFYKEIAIGSGFGIRLDLTYFVLRFDIGIRIFDPTRDVGEKWVIKNINFTEDRWFRKYYTFNLALGYPF
jgi:outer membrane protein assembly factor BamA